MKITYLRVMITKYMASWNLTRSHELSSSSLVWGRATVRIHKATVGVDMLGRLRSSNTAPF